MSDLVLCDEPAASVRLISIAVGSMLIPISVQCHHAVPAEWRNLVVANFALRQRVYVVVSNA
jgi:hypothetical protein